MSSTPLSNPPPLYDREQREIIARELDCNIMVEAAAGTGKTASMVGRMLALLRSGKCENIRTMAAVTFTRKAAAELRSRFQTSLEQELREAPNTGGENLQRALGHVEQCFIGTIHSFCARLLRERPVEAGVNLAFEEIDEQTDQRVRAEAWDAFVTGLLADDPNGFVQELGHLGIRLGDLEKAFDQFTLFPDVDEWPLPETASQMPQCDRLTQELDDYIAHMAELAPMLPQDAGNDKLIPRFKRLPRIVSHYEKPVSVDELMEILELFDQSAQVVQKEWKKTGVLSGDDAKRELIRWDRFRENVAGPALRYWRERRYVLVIRVLLAARALYDDMRRERGQLNFQDLLMKAAALLRENPNVRRYFQSRFSHLLVDEFQDTDPIQAEVIMLLASSDPDEPAWRQCVPRPGSLFLVGDPKQSIYRFRRADIVTYNEVKEIVLSGGDGLAVNLTCNFRAMPPLIEWINGVFEPGELTLDPGGKALLRFPRDETERSPSYVPLVAGREKVAPGEFSGIYRLSVPDRLGPVGRAVEYEADFIARTIRRALDSGAKVSRTKLQMEGGRSDAADPSDFMIITRNTTHLSTYARALQRYGIPHQVAGGSALNEVQEIDLLYSYLRAVMYPHDPVALVAVLRAEIFGISDCDLYAFKKAGGLFSYTAPMPPGLEPECADAIGDAYAQLKRHSLWIARMPAVAAFEAIAADIGLPELAASRPGGDVEAGSLYKAFELLRGIQAQVWSAAQLLEHLGRLIEREEKYDGISVLSGTQPAVRVMNLHKAKGLEAPVVFLADPSGEFEHDIDRHIDRSGRKVLGYLAIYGAGTGSRRGRLLAHATGWDSLVEEEKQFIRAEALRLRYVAATRSGAATIITQRGKKNARNPWRYFDSSLDPERDLPDPGPQEAPVLRRVPMVHGEFEEAELSIAARLGVAREATYESHGIKEYALAGAADTVEHLERTSEDAEPTPAISGEHGALWGEVIHMLLQAAMEDEEVELESLAQAALTESDMDISLAAGAAAVVRTVMTSHIWSRAQAGKRHLSEVPLQMPYNDKTPVPTMLRGVIDLAFEEESGWVLVDYKTDRASGKQVENLAARYAPQVRLYAEAWERCTGERVKEAFLYFLDGAQLQQVLP